MINISNTAISLSTTYRSASKPTEESFDDKVRHYIEKNKPQGKLSELLDQMRTLSPEKAVTMQQLSNALLYSDSCLRKNKESKEYTDNTLDKFTFQLLGANVFFNNMMYKNFTQSDDDTSL